MTGKWGTRAHRIYGYKAAIDSGIVDRPDLEEQKIESAMNVLEPLPPCSQRQKKRRRRRTHKLKRQ